MLKAYLKTTISLFIFIAGYLLYKSRDSLESLMFICKTTKSHLSFQIICWICLLNGHVFNEKALLLPNRSYWHFLACQMFCAYYLYRRCCYLEPRCVFHSFLQITLANLVLVSIIFQLIIQKIWFLVICYFKLLYVWYQQATKPWNKKSKPFEEFSPMKQ